VVAWTGMLGLIVARYHYTIDVIISFYITSAAWSFYHLVVSDKECQGCRLLKWFEEYNLSDASIVEPYVLEYCPVEETTG